METVKEDYETMRRQKPERIEYLKKYRMENKEKKKAYNDNQPYRTFNCPCGGTYDSKNKYKQRKHENSKKHQNYLKQ